MVVCAEPSGPWHMAHLPAKRSFAGAFCAITLAADAIIRSTDNAIVFLTLSLLMISKLFVESLV